MSKKIILLIIIFVSGFLPLTYFNANRTTPQLYINDEIDNTLDAVSAPKSSSYTIREVWNREYPTEIDKVAISADGEYITGGYDDNVSLFTKSSSKALWEYESPNGNEFQDVSISHDGNYIAIADNIQGLLLNNSIESPKTEIWRFPSTSDPSNAIDISDNGNYVSYVNNSHLFLLNNSFSLNKQPEWSYDLGGLGVDVVAISGNGSYIITCQNNILYLFNNTKTTPKTFQWQFDTTANVIAVAILNNSKYIAAANSDREIYLLIQHIIKEFRCGILLFQLA